MGFINFQTKTRDEYTILQNKNPDTLYFIKDEGKIIKNNIEYGGGNSEEISGLMVEVTSAIPGVKIIYSNLVVGKQNEIQLDPEQTVVQISLPSYGTWKFKIQDSKGIESPEEELIVDTVKLYTLFMPGFVEVEVSGEIGATIYYGLDGGSFNGNKILTSKTETIRLPGKYGTWNFYMTKNGQTSSTISLEINNVQKYDVSLSFSVTFGVKIQIGASDPTTAVTYIEDAVGMSSGWNNWKDKNFFTNIKPCILRNGEVVKYLQRDNYTKYEDGSSATLTTLGDDVMIEIPKIGYKITTDGSYHYIYVTDDPNAEGYCYAAHSREKEGDCDKIYIGAYLAYNSSSKLYSVSGKSPTTDISLINSRTYATNRGTGYELFSFYPLTLLQCLFLIIYKDRDGQSALGQGYTGASAKSNTGITNSNTFCYGSTSATTHIKFLGIEDFWGNLYQWIDGIRTNSSRQIHTWYKDFNGVDNDSGNHQYTAEGPSSNQGGYMKNIVGGNYGGFCEKEASGSSTTYWADGSILYAGGCAHFGGDWNDGSIAGPFYLYVYYSASNSYSSIGARMMYKHLAE